MKKYTLLRVFFCLVLFLTITSIFSCKKSPSYKTGNSNVGISGNWHGMILSSDKSDADTVTLVISQSAANFTGVISFNETDYSAIPPVQKSYTGTLIGTVMGNNVTMTLTAQEIDDGQATLAGTVNVAGNSMSGTYGIGTGGTWSFIKD